MWRVAVTCVMAPAGTGDARRLTGHTKPDLADMCDATMCDATVCEPTMCEATMCDATVCDATVCEPTVCEPSDATVCEPTVCEATMIRIRPAMPAPRQRAATAAPASGHRAA